MLRIMTDEEVKAGNERRAFLHASPFTIDNLTAVLMDSSTGDLGLYEVQARAKAHGILNYLRVITGADIPERRDEPPSPTTPHPAQAPAPGKISFVRVSFTSSSVQNLHLPPRIQS